MPLLTVILSEPPRVVLGQDALPLLVTQLKASLPPYPTPPPPFTTPASRRSLVQTDFDIYEEVCGLIESLCIDVEDVRLSLARGLTFPDGEHGGIACLSDLLTFVDKGDYSPYWTPEERPSKEKGFDLGKGAIVKAIVETAGEEKNTDTLWDDSEEDKPGGEFVSCMVDWIRTHKGLKETSRDDLIICATLSLGNICRRGMNDSVPRHSASSKPMLTSVWLDLADAHSTAIVKSPISLAPDLAALLQPDTDIKVKHGVIGLLKHLAQSQGCRATLGEAGIIQRLGTSQIWGDKGDIAEIVQVAAIGVAKHMCSGESEWHGFSFPVAEELADLKYSRSVCAWLHSREHVFSRRPGRAWVSTEADSGPCEAFGLHRRQERGYPCARQRGEDCVVD